MSVKIPLGPYYAPMPYGPGSVRTQMPAAYVPAVMGSQSVVTAVQISPPVNVPAAALPQAAPETITTVKAAWEKYFGAFITKDISQIVACYDETSHVRMFNNVTSAKSEYIGLDSVRKMYEDLVGDLTIDLTDFSSFEINVADVDEDAGQVFFAWNCLPAGILAATSTFIYARNFKIWKQNTVISKTGQQGTPIRAPSSTPLATPTRGNPVIQLPTGLLMPASVSTPVAPAPSVATPVEQGLRDLPAINISPTVHVTVQEPVPFKALSGPALESAMRELQKMQAQS